ncbi:MAG TPA: hypothetical protein VGM98_04290 [Schlesneria sp.]|jgi:hypothetical protein
MTRTVALLGLLTTGLMGCGGLQSPSGIVPVSGVVIYNDVPVADAVVTFIPEKGPKATATTDTDGQFKLTTTLPNDGAVKGVHQITIELMEPADPAKPYAMRKSLLPEKYASLKDSGLKETISGPATLELKLSDK